MLYLANLIILNLVIPPGNEWSKISTIKPSIGNNLDLLVKNNL